MADKTLQLDVVTPERTIVSEEVDIVMAPGYFGEFGALPNHIPFLAQLEPGEVKYRKGNHHNCHRLHVTAAGDFFYNNWVPCI